MDSEGAEPDLEQIANELADVERALGRLENDTYGTDEATGEPLPDDLLAENPTPRRTVPPADDPAASEPPEPQ
jgi:RNA polymerase-binding transcription factor DksA